MKPLVAFRTRMLIAGLAATWLAAGAVTARAGKITFDVSGTMLPVGGTGSSCSVLATIPLSSVPVLTCPLGGDIIINDKTGAIISEDVTFTGYSLPSNGTVGPFTQNLAIGRNGVLTVLVIGDSNGDVLDLNIATSAAGSVVGYTGGPIGNETTITASDSATWIIASANGLYGVGSLTREGKGKGDFEETPEPASVLLLASGLTACGLLRKRWR